MKSLNPVRLGKVLEKMPDENRQPVSFLTPRPPIPGSISKIEPTEAGACANLLGRLLGF